MRDNNEFKPFKIQEMFSYGEKVSKLGEILTIIGIRKDGKKKVLSSAYEKEYGLFDPVNSEINETLAKMDAEFSKIKNDYNKKKTELLARVKAIPVKEKIQELKQIYCQ